MGFFLVIGVHFVCIWLIRSDCHDMLPTGMDSKMRVDQALLAAAANRKKDA